MKNILVLVALFIITAPLLAQTTVYDVVDPNNQNASLLYNKKSSNGKEPFLLMDYFSLGSITLVNGQVIGSVKLNYDPFRDFLVVREGEKDIIINRRTVKQFKFYDGAQDKDFIFQSVKKGDENFYAEVLYTCDSITIYKRHRRDVRSSSPDIGYGSNSFGESNRYIDNSEFYCASPGNMVVADKKSEDFERWLKGIAGTLDIPGYKRLKFSSGKEQSIVAFFAGICR